MALEDLKTASPEQSPLVQVGTWTILLSVVAHGATAGFLSTRYGARMSSLGDMPELELAHEPRICRRTPIRDRSHQGNTGEYG